MKSKAQIEHFLKKRKYASEMDYLMISSYCQKEHGIKLHHPTDFHQDSDSLTCADFIQWTEHGFAAGDVVKWGENIGLVQNSTNTELKICLRIDGNGPTFDLITVPVQCVTPAGDNAVQRIKMTLSENNLEFGNPYFMITDKFIPGSGSLVEFTNLKNGEHGYGVARIVHRDGEIHMYCYFKDNGEVEYGMDEPLGNVRDFQFSGFGAADYPRKLLDQKLGKVGKTWNHFLKRIEPLHMKCEIGETYFYITDKMTVASDIERGKTASHKRYLAGNYFKSEHGALTVLSAEIETRRKYLAEPGI